MITKIKYERLFPTGSFANEKIGFEMDVEVGSLGSLHNSELMDKIEYLRGLAEQSHKEKYPHLYSLMGNPMMVDDNKIIDVKWTTATPDNYDGKSFNVSKEFVSEVPPYPIPETKETATQRIINQINQCSDPKVLESFKLLSRNNEEIRNAYESRVKSFQSNKP